MSPRRQSRRRWTALTAWAFVAAGGASVDAQVIFPNDAGFDLIGGERQAVLPAAFVDGARPLEGEPITTAPVVLAEPAPVYAPPIVAPAEATHPIDLPTALHLAGSESLAVALAREQWREAQARVAAADAMWLPSIRLGLNYNKHEGVIQDVVGDAFNTSRGAFYNGLGAGAVGAG